MAAAKLVPVLMAGGSGTRLWPLSREGYPKQLLSLTNEHSLLQNAALRATRIPGAAPLVIICGDAHRFLVAQQLQDVGIRNATIILEPQGRNSAPAATVAALHVQASYGDAAQVFLMSADHDIPKEKAFVRAIKVAAKAAAAGHLMTFGIKPTAPATGFGYLKAGKPLKGGPSGARQVDAFVEKPDGKTAKRFLKSRRYYWNGGMFLFSAGLYLSELQRIEPAMVRACSGALAAAARDADFIRLDATAFARARKDSIDYAVMEKTKQIALVPLDAGWDDIGTWAYMGNLKPSDRKGNRTHGDVLLEDVHDTLIRAESRLVTAVGIRDHVIVETRDAVLVTTRDRAQDVKQIVQALKKAGRSEAQTHTKVYRPWGWYDSVAEGPGFQVKRIGVNPGQKLSLQLHHKRAEHWVVVSGTARVTVDNSVQDLEKNHSVFIPLGATHRLENTTKKPVEIIEVQCGSYLGEDDIVRLEDVYGRTAS